jgi:serine phosphatase RsbU (regulator of sigma subunit)/anti-sigma regulatory factor (Ser/Thr protein kinase)/putative methionine-R-sulfoxide reductase with GAF domain
VTSIEPESRRVLADLQRFTDAALAHLAIDDLLAELLERLTEILGTDTAAFLLIEPDGKILRARAAKGIEEEVEQQVRIPVGPGFAGRIAAERRPLYIPDVDHADILNPILRQKGIRSLLGVPLLIEGRVIGVLHVGSLTPREFTDEDTALLQLVGDRAAMAIARAQLYEEERAAREAAERAVSVIRAVQRVTDAALTALSLEELLPELLDRITEILHSDTAAFLLLEPDGKVLRARAAKGIEEEVEQGVRLPVGPGFAGRIAAERRPIFIPDVDHGDILNPILRQKGIRSLLGVPLLVEDRVIGVLHVGSLTPREFTDEDTALLQLAGDRAALAIEHAQMFEQRRLAEALQRALLPQDLAGITGIEVAARYLPAAQGARLGGDWYDLFPLDRGLVGIAIGDVVGRGLPAAALMAQLRTALRAYAVDGHEPTAVIERVSRLLSFLNPGTMTTAAYLELDPETETATVASAGHPPPLVIAPDGSASFLDVIGDPALGVTPMARYRAHPYPMPGGSTILMYTDGVVEVRGESIDVGLERLRRLAERPHEDVEALCDAIIDELVADGRPADDVALLAVRLAPLGDELSTTWPARAEALVSVRHVMRRWLRHHGAGDDEAYDITVASQEACANAIEHAYAPGERTFELDASNDGGTIEVVVRDRGRWRAARGRNRGRGLPMMEALMDTVEVRQGDGGTVVVLRRALRAATP